MLTERFTGMEKTCLGFLEYGDLYLGVLLTDTQQAQPVQMLDGTEGPMCHQGYRTVQLIRIASHCA